LQAPAEATSVIDVAFQCGFLNPGHFARDYRLAFGELPSETLRNIKRRGRRPAATTSRNGRPDSI
jgi:transcriptional regulator GlxA family with amidase domain